MYRDAALEPLMIKSYIDMVGVGEPFKWGTRSFSRCQASMRRDILHRGRFIHIW